MVNLDVGIQQDAPVQWKSGGRLANQGVWKGEVLAIQVKGRTETFSFGLGAGGSVGLTSSRRMASVGPLWGRKGDVPRK